MKEYDKNGGGLSRNPNRFSPVVRQIPQIHHTASRLYLKSNNTRRWLPGSTCIENCLRRSLCQVHTARGEPLL